MARRISTRICPEGWYYLFVVAFILGGAALREVNLLLMLGGMMIGPFLLNWRLVKLMLRAVDVHRQLPRRVCAGDPLAVAITAHNGRGRLTSWSIVVEDRAERQGQSRDDVMKVRVMVPHIPAGRSRTVEYQLRLSRRGRYRFDPLRSSTRFPLGLAKAEFTADDTATLLVGPRIGNLTRQWTQMTDMHSVGNQRTQRRQGHLEGDYYGLREWRSGDSQRWIHWRTSARLGELAVRQFEQQRNRDLALVLDLCQEGEAEEKDLIRAEIAVSFLATAVADACRQGGVRIVVGIAGQDTFFWDGPASTMLADEIWDQLALVAPGDGRATAALVRKMRRCCRTDAELVVISTRPALDSEQLITEPSGAAAPGPPVAVGQLRWIDCRSDQHASYFSVDL